MNANHERRSQDPMIAAYLDSLARELTGTENRDEVLQSVREHIDEALASAPEPVDAATVRAILDELGPVERISAGQDRPAAVPAPRRQWVLLVTGALAVASLALVLVLPFVSVPLALATLAVGIVALVRRRESRRGGWAVVIVSSLTLVVALVAALVFVRWAPGTPTEEPSRTPTQVSSPSE
ncbi:MAG: hypothetical protein J0H23_11530 [Micrococcales bacterium]|nr:hypothetical protein [Micrococcales bacterium]